jgi:ABC-type branched-subunit amino acid transport system ATPase component
MTSSPGATAERQVKQTPTKDEPLLEVSDLRCTFGSIDAVDGASLGVRHGSLTGMIGPNGAGKTTVINAIGGQVRATGGSIRFAGADLAGRPPHEIARSGVTRTFQTPNLFPRLTVLENMLLGAPAWKGESLAAALVGGLRWRRGQDALIEQAQTIMLRFDMLSFQNELGGALSGGQKRIVEIMRALMAAPRLLLLDEPMAGVNPSLARRIATHLTELQSDGMTMLMIEHDLRLVGDICDPVIVMVQGRVLAEAPLAELQRNEEVVRAYLTG